jgi:murein L,D-transpeptidase YafK
VTGRIVASLMAMALGATLALAAPASARDSLEQARLPAAPTIDRVVVLKSERRLVLLRGDTVVRVYNVALGRYPEGHKRRQGDARTPEGEYTLDYKLEDSAFYRAIHISYPNARDLARAQADGVDPGGKIMIHGLPNDRSADYVGHPRIDWTQGCIAVTNREMDELFRLVETGTPIEIHP